MELWTFLPTLLETTLKQNLYVIGLIVFLRYITNYDDS